MSDSNKPDPYIVRFYGPGTDVIITVNDIEDLLIIKALLEKVEKSLEQNKTVLGE